MGCGKGEGERAGGEGREEGKGRDENLVFYFIFI